ncbi:MAG: WD40 repeat domain-containing serine/threonine protein kinase [Planctomycetota bacterium]
MSSDAANKTGEMEALLREFLAIQRGGGNITVEEFAVRHPGQADEIREYFPTMVLLELAKPRAEDWNQTPTPQDEQDPTTPEVLDDYRLVREIGRGGMGVVYEAEQISLRRRVAIKILPNAILSSESAVARFQRESTAAAILHHTHIVPVFGTGHSRGWHYYVMQLIDGRGLDTVVRELKHSQDLKSGVLDLLANMDGSSSSKSSNQRAFCHFVARIGQQAAEALQFAHDHGVLHRDIKPSNLLLDESGELWITDFGLAKLDDEHDLTRTGDFVGTVRYVAPESIAGRADSRSDVYALGLTLYELLALRPGIVGDRQSELLQNALHPSVTPLRQIARELPTDLCTIIQKAITPLPGDRYETAGQLAEDLQRFRRDEPIRARPLSPIGRLVRWQRRHRGLAASIATVAVLLVMMTAGAFTAAIYFGSLNRRLENTVASLDLARSQAESRSLENRQLAEQADGARELSDRTSYRAQVALAYNRLASGDAPGAIDALNRALPVGGQPDRRDWEWFYLKRWYEGSGVKLERPGSFSGAVDYSPDGRHVVAAWMIDSSRDSAKEELRCDVLLHDASSGLVVERLCSVDRPIDALAFDPSGQQIAVAAQRRDIRIFDVASKEWLASMARPNEQGLVVRRMRFNPDGDQLLAMWKRERLGPIQAGTALLYSCRDGKTLLATPAKNADFTADGRSLLSVSRNARNVELTDLATWQSNPWLPESVYGGGIWGITASTDGSIVAAASTDKVLVWDMKSKVQIARLLIGHRAANITISKDGRLITVSGFSNNVQIWDVARRRKITTLLGTSVMRTTSFSPDGDWIVAEDAEGDLHRFSTRQAASGLTWETRSMSQTSSMSLSTEDRLIHAVDTDTVETWDSQSQRRLRKTKINTSTDAIWPRFDMALSSDGSQVAAPMSADASRVGIFDTTTGEVVGLLTGHRGRVVHVDVDQSGRRMMTVSADAGLHHVRLWDAQAFAKIRDFEPIHELVAATISPDGQLIAVADSGNKLIVWRADSGDRISTIDHPGGITCLQFDHRGERLAASRRDDGEVHAWDLRKGESLFQRSGLQTPCGLAWSPSGRRLAVAAQETVHVLDASDGEQLIALKKNVRAAGTLGYTACVIFSEDGLRIVANAARGEICVWDANTISGTGFQPVMPNVHPKIP